ncbi:MAG: NAD(P)/FAD-dependent oxidoreductase [Bacillota bacterium]
MIDYLIVGGGVIGTLIARELSQYKASVTLLEKEDHLAQIQTTHNSALVHSPVVIPPSSGYYKSKFALEGNRMYKDLVKAFDVPAMPVGAFLLAMDDKELSVAKKMAEEAMSRGIDNVRLLSGEALRKNEPNIPDEVVGGLDMPSAMTVDTSTLVRRVASNAKSNGVTIRTGETVISVDITNEETFTVHTQSGGEYNARCLINAAGIMNAHIASMVEKHVPYKMEPRLGEYYVLRSKKSKPLSNKILFPVPSKSSKGVLVTPQPGGTVRLGPTAKKQDSLENNEVTKEGLRTIREDVTRLLKNVPYDQTLYTYAGIRASINLKDFYIHPSLEHEHFIHVAGIDSPGVTAAPAIAKHVVESIIMSQKPLKKKAGHAPWYYEK